MNFLTLHLKRRRQRWKIYFCFTFFIDDEDERNLRRISYLRATKDDRMHVDSEGEEESNVPTTPKHR